MAEYLIQGETLTGIADKIRPLLGLTGPMTPEQMQTNLTTEQANIAAALAAIAEKGVEVPDGSNSNALAGLIGAIEAGGGNVKFGTITPSAETSEITIEHGYGGNYNVAALFSTFSIGAYAKIMFCWYAYAINGTQGYDSYSYNYSNATYGKTPTTQGTKFGHLCKEYDKEKLTLEIAEGLLSHTGVKFDNRKYFWLVGQI